MKNLIDLINQSDLTTIGYKFTGFGVENIESESQKDFILKKIPHISIGEINGDTFKYDLKSTIREHRLNCLLYNNQIPTHVVLDFTNMKPTPRFQTKYHLATQIIYDTKMEMYRDCGQLYQTKFKSIITSPIWNNDPPTYRGSYQLIGGHNVVIESDLVLMVSKNKIEIIKNRYGEKNITIPIVEFENY
jgi:hypothetical protein